MYLVLQYKISATRKSAFTRVPTIRLRFQKCTSLEDPVSNLDEQMSIFQFHSCWHLLTQGQHGIGRLDASCVPSFYYVSTAPGPFL